MIKKLIYGIICFSVFLTLVGCSSDNKDSTSTNDNTSSETENQNETKDISLMSYDEAKEYLNTLSETDASVFEYTTNEMADGECAISGYSGTNQILVIPEMIDGLKVTKLSSWLFANNEDMIAVKLPNSIKTIESNVFVNCDNILYITGLENVEYLGEGSFFCKNLKYLEFGDSVKEAEDGIIIYGDNITLRLKKDSYLADIGNKTWYRDGHGVTVELY